MLYNPEHILDCSVVFSTLLPWCITLTWNQTVHANNPGNRDSFSIVFANRSLKAIRRLFLIIVFADKASLHVTSMIYSSMNGRRGVQDRVSLCQWLLDESYPRYFIDPSIPLDCELQAGWSVIEMRFASDIRVYRQRSAVVISILICLLLDTAMHDAIRTRQHISFVKVQNHFQHPSFSPYSSLFICYRKKYFFRTNWHRVPERRAADINGVSVTVIHCSVKKDRSISVISTQ